MEFPQVHLSRPAVILPARRLDNDAVIDLVHQRYRGEPGKWPAIASGIRRLFRLCRSRYRYLEQDQSLGVADFALQAARACLEQNGVSTDELDLLIYGGIAREYFEPATAMEVAGKLGISLIHAFDVTSACAGQLEAIQIAAAYLALDPRRRAALVCSGELTRGFLDYDVQSLAELETKVAGLTVGNAAAAWLIRRQPFARGGIRLRSIHNHCLPQHWHLCTAPIDGCFTSYSQELFRLNVHVAPEIVRVLDELGMTPADIDHYVLHQPSESIVRKVLDELGVDSGRVALTHHLYANTASTTVALAMHQTLQERDVRPGDRLLLCCAAAGFSMITAVGEWAVAEGEG